MREWQEDVRAAGLDPSQMQYPMQQYGQAPIFITNQPPVPFQQGQTGYSGQPFPQGQPAVHT